MACIVVEKYFNCGFELFGLNHEDSYIITKELADETKTDTVEAISIEIPPNTTIINLETEKTNMLMPAIYLLNFLMRIV